MNRVFYAVAAVGVIVLILLGLLANRKAPVQPDANSSGGASFNADQLQDAARKSPATR